MRRHVIETTYGHVHVRVRDGSGTPLLLSSPGLSSGRIYERLADQLDDRALVIPDRIGFGLSDRPAERIPFEAYSATTIEVLDTLGVEEFDVFGIHTGSVEAIDLAVSHPDRVRRLAVVEVPAFSVEEVEQFFVNRIEFTGNSTTHDEVIRRELNIVENAVFNTEALKYSVRRLNQLGFFEPLDDTAVDVQKNDEVGKEDKK